MNERIVVCSAEKGGKIRDVSFYGSYDIMAKEWRKRHEDMGMTVEVSSCDLPSFLSDDKGGVSERNDTRDAKPRWSIHVRCVERGKSYKTVKSCAMDLGLSAYRIRRVLDTKMTVDGLHFTREVHK